MDIMAQNISIYSKGSFLPENFVPICEIILKPGRIGI